MTAHIFTSMMAAGALLIAAPAIAQTSAPTRPIAAAARIDEAGFVKIGGIDQWVTIRGSSRANPVILVVGGTQVDGPGATMSPYVDTFHPWEQAFTVVQWDMRGSGKTFVNAGAMVGPELTVDRLVEDGIELSEYLRARLGKRRIVILGINFGSTVGVKMALRRPGLFSAYVGAGQIVANRPERERFVYDRDLRLATAAGDVAGVADLTFSGPAPLRSGDPAKIAAFSRVNARYRPPNPVNPMAQALKAPGWTPQDLRLAQTAIAPNEQQLGRAWGEEFDFRTLGPEFKIPVFVIQGADNDIAPTPQAQAWLAGIKAPKKGFAAIPVAGNHAIETHGDAFLAELERLVRATAAKGQ